MIEPTPDDIGRMVIYLGSRDVAGQKVEQGVITSFNDSVVFVRYGDRFNSEATYRRDLEWMAP